MKTYNLSKIMKEAHRMRKYEGLTMSVALTLAWSKAKRNEFYWVIPERKPRKRIKTNTDCPIYQQMMHDYYNRGSRAYYGD